MARSDFLSEQRARRYLIRELVRRELVLKYRGSVLGLGWSFLYPLLMLAAFTVVFGGIFGGRWSANDGSTSVTSGFDMALFIYCGLALFTPFAEVISNAPKLLHANQNFVRKVVFPTEVLPLVSLVTASIHGIVHVSLLVLAAMLSGHVFANALLIPFILIPAWLMTLGLAWFLTAAGAYIRDLAHGVPLLMQLVMFMLPIFYPSNAAPDFLQTINKFNPLAVAIEDLRRTLLRGESPDMLIWFAMLAIGLVCVVGGYVFFSRCREEFADVL
jgi:lipopolysaccharide transport system permease protein